MMCQGHRRWRGNGREPGTLALAFVVWSFYFFAGAAMGAAGALPLNMSTT